MENAKKKPRKATADKALRGGRFTDATDLDTFVERPTESTNLNMSMTGPDDQRQFTAFGTSSTYTAARK